MINQLDKNHFPIPAQVVGARTQGIETRLGIEKRDMDGADPNVNALYSVLKTWWSEKSAVDSEELIRQLRNFTLEDGGRPYQNTLTHTAVLAQLMQLLKQDGGVDSPQYAALNDGLRLSVVSNGFYHQFMNKMMERPEEPEDW